jgi:hypothetical protein
MSRRILGDLFSSQRAECVRRCPYYQSTRGKY